jgi:cytosine/adenosine deaminase-related metal-dependent hydrolase
LRFRGSWALSPTSLLATNIMGCFDRMKSTYLGDFVFDGERVRKGYLRLEGDSIAEVCEGDPPMGTRGELIFSGFVNAHTHLGDSFAYPAPRISMEELVAPPCGYKHRVLGSATTETKTDGMLRSLAIMSSSGTTVFSDFREEGLRGLTMLRGLLRPEHPRAILLGRPAAEEVLPGEVDGLLEASEGIGMSSVTDCPPDLLKRLADSARSRGKLFSIHFSEGVREDVDQVLALRPDFVIHATKATKDDLIALAEAKVPVVVCPRSNEFFGNKVDIPGMLAAGVDVGLGTDNGMICRPDMFEEVRAAFRLSAAMGGMSALDAVRMATTQGRKILKADGNTTPPVEKERDFTVVKVPGKDPLRELVTAVEATDVLAVVRGGKVWRPASWR